MASAPLPPQLDQHNPAAPAPPPPPTSSSDPPPLPRHPLKRIRVGAGPGETAASAGREVVDRPPERKRSLPAARRGQRAHHPRRFESGHERHEHLSGEKRVGTRRCGVEKRRWKMKKKMALKTFQCPPFFRRPSLSSQKKNPTPTNRTASSSSSPATSSTPPATPACAPVGSTTPPSPTPSPTPATPSRASRSSRRASTSTSASRASATSSSRTRSRCSTRCVSTWSTGGSAPRTTPRQRRCRG